MIDLVGFNMSLWVYNVALVVIGCKCKGVYNRNISLGSHHGKSSNFLFKLLISIIIVT